MNKCMYPDIVFVSAYDRFRLNRWEHVSQYWRRLPNR